MSVLRKIALLAVVLATMLCAHSASAVTTANAQTRVWDFTLARHALVGGDALRMPENHRAKSLAECNVASDYLLAAEGLEAAGGVASDARLFQAYKAELAAQEIQGADAVGSALKADPYHRSASFVTDMAADGKMFSLGNRTGTVNLTQVLGEMNGVPGRFEWIVDGSGNLTHQMFVRGGRITGVPIAP